MKSRFRPNLPDLLCLTVVAVLVTLSWQVTAHSHETAAPAEKPAINATTLSEAETIAAGKQLVAARCSLCHSAPSPNMHTSEEWPGVLKVMAPRAKLRPEEVEQVLAYLQQETTPKK